MHTIITIIAKYFIAIPLFIGIYVFWQLPKKQKIELVLFLLVSATITTVLVKLATSLHQDPRPFVRDGVVPYFTSSTDNGFPSDHTAFSAVIAFVVLHYSRKLGLCLAVLALVIGSARVIAGVHHGQDIVGGFLLAAAGVTLGWYAQQWLGRTKPGRRLYKL